jgi:hypothetical protein
MFDERLTTHARAKAWLDAHMKYMPSDLTDLRMLLDQVYSDGFNAGASEQARTDGGPSSDIPF